MSFFAGDLPMDETNDTIRSLAYRRSPRASPRASPTHEDGPGRSPINSPTMTRSPRSATQVMPARSPVALARSGFRASPTHSITSMGSSRSYRISTETGGDREMTGDEVNALVSSALRRARKATNPRSNKNKGLVLGPSSPEHLGIMPISSFASVGSIKTTQLSPINSNSGSNVEQENEEFTSPEKLGGMMPLKSALSLQTQSTTSHVKMSPPKESSNVTTGIDSLMKSNIVTSARNSPMDFNVVANTRQSPVLTPGPEKLGMMPMSSISVQEVFSSHSGSWSASELPLSRSPTQELDDILDTKSIVSGSSFGEPTTPRSCGESPRNRARSVDTHEFSTPIGSPLGFIPEVVVEETNSDISRPEDWAQESSKTFGAHCPSDSNAQIVRNSSFVNSDQGFHFVDECIDAAIMKRKSSDNVTALIVTKKASSHTSQSSAGSNGGERNGETTSNSDGSLNSESSHENHLHVSRVGSEVVLSMEEQEGLGDETSEYTEETASDDAQNHSSYTEETIDEEDFLEQGMEVELMCSFISEGELRSRALTGSLPSSAASTPKSIDKGRESQILSLSPLNAPRSRSWESPRATASPLNMQNCQSQGSPHANASPLNTPKSQSQPSPHANGSPVNSPKSQSPLNTPNSQSQGSPINASPLNTPKSEGQKSPTVFASVSNTPSSQGQISPTAIASVPSTPRSEGQGSLHSASSYAESQAFVSQEQGSPRVQTSGSNSSTTKSINFGEGFQCENLETGNNTTNTQDEEMPLTAPISLPLTDAGERGESPSVEQHQDNFGEAATGWGTPTSQGKEVWWTSPIREAESVTQKAEEQISIHNNISFKSIDDNISHKSGDNSIESGMAKLNSTPSECPSIPVKETILRFPSPQLERCATPDSRKENSQPRSRSPVSIQSSENVSFDGKEVHRYVMDNSQIEFRHPYPLPPPIPKPRSSADISRDNTLKVPDVFKQWTQPKAELEKLLLAVHGNSLPRRSNACGAMKVLSLKKRNQMTLVRTRGFLDCLVFAMSADIPEDMEKDMALDARGRAVTTLLNVVEPKDNRTLVFTHPGLAAGLVKVIKEDQGEARVHACGTLGMLAKTPVNRQLMITVEGLIDVLAKVLLGAIDDDRPSPGTYNDEDESDGEDTDGFGSSSFSSESCSVQGSVQDSIAASATQSVSHSLSHSESGSINDDASLGVLSSVSSIHPPGRKKKCGKSIRRQKNDKYYEFLKQARTNACATLSHLSKHCSISDELADNDTLVDSVVRVSREFDNPIHTKCIEILCNFSRFPSNTAAMARNDALVNTLMKCGKSKKLEDRIWALRTLQNIASDSTSKVILANSRILILLSICAMRKDFDEQLAAVAALYNLSTEPGAVVPLTNTRNVVATLVHLAHNTLSRPEIRRLACDALATVGLWLQTLAGSGKVPNEVTKVLLPSHATTGWERWD